MSGRCETSQKSRYRNRQRALKRIGFASYREYLASDLWFEIKSKVLSKSSQCRFCGCNAYTVHHHDYSMQALLGDDEKALMPVCRSCHYKIEFSGDEKLLSTNEISKKTQTIVNGGGKAKRKYKPVCRCCRKPRKILGNNDICLPCYHKYRHRVHEVAAKVSG